MNEQVLTDTAKFVPRCFRLRTVLCPECMDLCLFMICIGLPIHKLSALREIAKLTPAHRSWPRFSSCVSGWIYIYRLCRGGSVSHRSPCSCFVRVTCPCLSRVQGRVLPVRCLHVLVAEHSSFRRRHSEVYKIRGSNSYSPISSWRAAAAQYYNGNRTPATRLHRFASGSRERPNSTPPRIASHTKVSFWKCEISRSI